MTEQNIFQEIDDDIERQKYGELWKKYGPWIVGAALVIILCTAAWTSWHSWRTKKDQEATANLFVAMDQSGDEPGKEMAALESFALANPGSTQTVLADLSAARMAAKAGNRDRAIQLYDRVSKEKDIDIAFRQFADLMSVRAQMDTGEIAVLQERLKPMLVNTSPWHYTAAEYEGYLALRAGDKQNAKEIFTALSGDPKTPPSLSARTTDVLRYISE